MHHWTGHAHEVTVDKLIPGRSPRRFSRLERIAAWFGFRALVAA